MTNQLEYSPITRENTAVVETHPTDNSQRNFFCTKTGFMSSTRYVKDSELLSQFITTLPQLVKDLAIYDTGRNIYWFPVVVQTEVGIIYPDGVVGDWKWKVAPIIAVSEEEQKQYPIPGTSPVRYYDSRLAVEQATAFDMFQFENAVKFMGTFRDSTPPQTENAAV